MQKKLNMEVFGERVGYFRRRAGFSQTQLAELVDRTKGTISRLERGNIESISLELACNIAWTLNVNLLDLIEEGFAEKVYNRDEEDIFALLELSEKNIVENVLEFATYEATKYNRTKNNPELSYKLSEINGGRR